MKCKMFDFARRSRMAAFLAILLGFGAAGVAVGARPEPVRWDALTPDDAAPQSLLIRYDPARAPRPADGGFRRIQTHAALNATVSHEYRRIPWQVVRLPQHLSLEVAAARYAEDPAVLEVEPNYRITLDDTVPNDPEFGQLWGMQRIEAPSAWDVTTGNSNIVVAVIDTGIRYTHEDLADNMWVNPNPTFGDLHGATWIDGGGEITSGDPMDDNNHGTHVAGTIGGVGDNGIGVAGVNWTVRLMALKFLGAGGSGWTADAVSALEYAIDHGARLSNNSWGGGGYSQALYDMIEAAGTANQLFVAAAGNVALDNDTYPHYPSSYGLDNVIAVASIQPSGTLSGFSCYGLHSVDIAAPGSGIYSSTAASDSSYAAFDGTSMATPHVAGAAALVLGMQPNLDYGTLRDILFDSATPNAALDGKIMTGGELNVAAAAGSLTGLRLDREAYRSDAVAQVTVVDALRAAVTNQATLNWWTTETPPSDSPSLAQGSLLLDRQATSIVYEASLDLGTITPAPVHGNFLHMEYVPETHATAEAELVSVPIDDVAPAILDWRTDSVLDDRIVVRWTTDEPALSGGGLRAAPSPPPPVVEVQASASFATNHFATFENLEELKLYYISVWAEDPAGNRTELPADPLTAEGYLQEATRGRKTVYQTDFERGGAGWSEDLLLGEEPCWQYGVPSYGPNPPSRSWGTRIHGRYPHTTKSALVSPPVRVGEGPEIHFTHWRDLRFTEALDGTGIVEVYHDGVWHNVMPYVSGTFSPVFNGRRDWETVRIRLPEAFSESTIRVRFRFESSDYNPESGLPAGWYIDNVQFSELQPPGVALQEIEVDDSDGGDGDGFLEPGETARLRLLSFNLTLNALEDLAGRLSVLAEGLPAEEVALIGGAPALLHYGTLEPYCPATNETVRLAIAETVDPQTRVSLFQSLTDATGQTFESIFETKIEARGTISGAVRDEADLAPVVGARVEARYGSALWTAITDSNGLYRLDGVYLDREYRVRASMFSGNDVAEATVRSPAENVDFLLGGARAQFVPDSLALQAEYGQRIVTNFYLSNQGGSRPLVYTLHPDYSEGLPGWLRIVEGRSGTVPAGETREIPLAIDTAGIEPPDASFLEASLRLESNDALGAAYALPVTLDLNPVTELAFDGVRVATPYGRVSPGQAETPLWVRLRNLNPRNPSGEPVIGFLSAVDTNKAQVSTNADTAVWSAIPGAEVREQDEDPFEVSLSPGLAAGEAVAFELEVLYPGGGGFTKAFSLVSSPYVITGRVVCVTFPDNQGVPANSNPVPVENARVRVEDTLGNPLGDTRTDTNGLYRLEGFHDETLWIFADPPENRPRMVPEPGRALDMTGNREENFTFRQDGTAAPYNKAPRLVIGSMSLNDATGGNGDGNIDPGEEFEWTIDIHNLGAAPAGSVTGLLELAAMNVPDIMTVTQGAADTPIYILDQSSPLQPSFRVKVSETAKRGEIQRFQVTVIDDDGVNPVRSWVFTPTLRVDPEVRLSGAIHFADGADTPENFHRTRVRRMQGTTEQILGVSDAGTFSFGPLSLGASGTVEVVSVPDNYARPEPIPFGPLDDDADLGTLTIPVPPVTVVTTDPAGLDFAFPEGHSATGHLFLVNDGTETVSLNASVVYRREPDEARTPPPAPMALGGAPETGLPAVQWDAVDAETAQLEEVVVRFADGVSRAEQKEILAANGLEPVFFFNSFPAALARRVAGPAPTLNTLATEALTLEEDERVLLVAPDERAQRMSTATPNDQRFGELYGMYNQRQTGGTLGADIRAPQAWNVTTGDASIVVAVCDTGIMIDHPDLAANIWNNPYPGTSEGVENDLHGWNVYDMNNDVNDGYGHGTHVAGTIGAVGNNSLGVAGVAWNVRLMAVRLSNPYGEFTTSARIAKAIEYAVENGAKISNHSWGGPDTAGVMESAIEFAEQNNHLIVASAGNSAENLDEIKTYPGYYSVTYPNVITVAASDHDGELASFTTFGPESVQLAAPGVDILSTVPDECQLKDYGTWPWDARYEFSSGTSMAAPHVSGVAALLWSRAPEASYKTIKEAILKGARRDARLEGWVGTAAHLDAWGAVQALGAEWLHVEETSLTLAPGQSTNLMLRVNDPPVLTQRTNPYEAHIALREISGAFTRTVPATATVLAGTWLEPGAPRIVNLEGYGDDLAPSPGDEIELWIPLENRGRALASDLTGVLTPAGTNHSVMTTDTLSWPSIYGTGSAESQSPGVVILDADATGDLLFTLNLYQGANLVDTFTIPVPVLPGNMLRGTVRSDPENAPVSNAWVEVWGTHGAGTSTAGDGSFLLRGLPDGDYRLRVLPEAHERRELPALALAGDQDLGVLSVSAPSVTFTPEAFTQSLPQGTTNTATLSFQNAAGIAAGPFTFSLHPSPRRRVALISDGTTLGPLVEPLSAMGFAVTRLANNFARIQRFYPNDSSYRMEQRVLYSRDAARLRGYDAVILDMSGPDGEGRLLTAAELAAFAEYADAGGVLVLTGAHPFSQPDNDGLADLLGVTELDRMATATNQAVTATAWSSPFLALHTNETLEVTTLAHDLASPAGFAAQTTLLQAGEAHKILRRSLGGAGAVYAWTGNPSDADWAKSGLRRDLLRGLLWKELIEGARAELPWLKLSATNGTVAVGDSLELDLTFNTGLPAEAGEQEAVLLVVGNTPGADTRAVPVRLDIVIPRFNAYTTGHVTDWRGEPLPGDGGPGSAIFQVLWAGPDGLIDPASPDGDGLPTGDDQILATHASGLSYSRFGVGAEGTPDVGRFNEFFQHRIPVDAAHSNVYVRAWDGESFEASLVYGDSEPYTLLDLAEDAHDFGSWSLTNLLRYGRDSNGDSLPDGWIVENRPDLDPREPIGPLSAAEAAYVDKLNVIKSDTRTPLPQQVVATTNWLFVLDTAYNRIVVYDRQTKTRVGYFPDNGGASGSANGEFSRPEGLDLDPRPGMDRLVVADTMNHRVQVLSFDPGTGAIAWERSIGSPGAGSLQFDKPSGVSILPATGDFFVADTENHRVQVIRPDGSFLWKIEGALGYRMKSPRGVAVDDALGVFVADTGNHRILQFTHQGAFVTTFGENGTGEGQFWEPSDIRVRRQTRADGAPAPRLVVTDTLNNRVKIIRPDGTCLITVGGNDPSPDDNGDLRLPRGTFPVPNSRVLYVADTGNERIQEFNLWLDADGDGMDDLWEDWNGLDSTRDDALEDPDGDGLLNIGEFLAGTDPLDPDTSGNGTGDLWQTYQEGFPNGPAALVSISTTTNGIPSSKVTAGESITLTATLDRPIPNDAFVWLTLEGASPRAARRMMGTTNAVDFVLTHVTLAGEEGWADALLTCGYVDPGVNETNQLFEVLAGEEPPAPPPLEPFPITAIAYQGGPPPALQLAWSAVLGGTYRIERTDSLIANPVVWTEVDTVTATQDPMTYTVPIGTPPEYFRVIRME